ncbi:hypothetical protein SAMN05216259_101278 [Actinacidiphila guanduensis]|uniref:Uncharacterized protein n=1 Tax=Actinacidiphila guanduensis TaxID=310781 RepID=A0A1G9VHM7_9ACTN|nr:hypothetical protein SAMN05216259_101278 [Actinacidiphila guanduensis]
MTSDVRSPSSRQRVPHPRRQDRGEEHHPRFIFVPALRKEPEAPFPATAAARPAEGSARWEPGSLNRARSCLDAAARRVRPARWPVGRKRRWRAPPATAHRYLGLAAAATEHRPMEEAFTDLGALAAAGTEKSRRRCGGPTPHAASACRLAALHIAKRDAGVPRYRTVVDVLTGLSGIGRHLLHRDRLAARERAESDGALRTAPASLADLCGPLRTKDAEVATDAPGPWIPTPSRLRSRRGGPVPETRAPAHVSVPAATVSM